MSKFSKVVARHMATIPENCTQAEYMMRLEIKLRGDRWPLFARYRLRRMAERGEIRRGSDTVSFFASGSGWPTWGPVQGKGKERRS